jgi:CRP-like cAMP-binding protein
MSAHKTITNKIKSPVEAKALDSLNAALLFSNLSKADIGSLLGAGQMKSFKKGKVLYRQEDAADTFYVIYQGWIRLFQTLLNGKDVIIEMATCGDTIGVDALFESFVHTNSAQVMEDVQLLCIPLALLKAQMAISATLSLNLLASLSRKHTRFCSDVALSSVRSAPERLASFLLKLCPADQKSNIVFHLPYDKTSIAYSLGMTRGSFSRALNILRQQVAIRIKSTRVEIDSVKQLKEFVHDPSLIKRPVHKANRK